MEDIASPPNSSRSLFGDAVAPEDVMPTVPFLMCGAITFFNANYYAQRVIGDYYYIRKAQDHAKRGVDRVELHTS